MRRLAVTILLTLVLAVCLGATASAGEPVATLLGDRQYWSTFAWDNPEGSRLFAAVPWIKLGMNQFETFKYAYRLQLSGVPVTLYAVRIAADIPQFGDFDLASFTSEKQESTANFKRLVQWCTANFGQRSAQIDRVTRIYKLQTFETSYTYWVVGTTIIRLTYSEVTEKEGKYYLTRIGYLDARHNKIRPAEQVLSCELDVKRLDPVLADIFPDHVTYKIDEADNVVKDLDDNVVSDELVSTATLLRFSKQTETMRKVSEIDKTTGAFRFSLFNSSKGGSTADVVIPGRCTQLQPGRQQ